jgi:nitroimidazol reductase NimA-like FMN-containing flavoprotein (pyridoxamine 5'-phosphate oxidase superfamily)
MILQEKLTKEDRMEKAPEKTKHLLASLLDSQKFAVLSTYSGGQPYVSLVAFAASEDLDRLFFVTARATRKFANILEHPRIAFLVDNRSNNESDFGEASAVTILGKARELA